MAGNRPKVGVKCQRQDQDPEEVTHRLIIRGRLELRVEIQKAEGSTKVFGMKHEVCVINGYITQYYKCYTPFKPWFSPTFTTSLFLVQSLFADDLALALEESPYLALLYIFEFNLTFTVLHCTSQKNNNNTVFDQ